MKILFNCSTNIEGGAIQNASNFIYNACRDRDSPNFIFIVSPAVNKHLKSIGLCNNMIIEVDTPAKSLISKKRILNIEKNFRPDLVYTMAGPSYVNFNTKHILGISDPFITHASFYHFFYNKSIYRGILDLLKCTYKSYRALKEGDFFLFQTQYSQSSFEKKFRIGSGRSKIVANAIGDKIFNLCSEKQIIKNESHINILVPAAYYPHKNLELVYKLFDKNLLKKDHRCLKFKLTCKNFLSKNSPICDCEVINIGPYNYSEVEALYSWADVIFIPSILETFSTSYLEAIAFFKPLVVPNIPFSREICQDYPVYYDQNAELSALNAIYKSTECDLNSDTRNIIMNKYGNQWQRYLLIKDILRKMITKA